VPRIGVKRPLEEVEDPRDRCPLEEGTGRGGRLLVLLLGLSASDCDSHSSSGTLAVST
jgi:hypothetical protein